MKLKSILTALLAIALCGGAVTAVNYGLGDLALANRERADLALMQALVAGGETFTEEPYGGEDENIRAVWASETGYLVETGVYGYADDVVLWVGVDFDGAVTGIVVRSLHETYGLGAGALNDVPFLAQFIGATGGLTVGESVDALTGATVTSKAVTKAVNSACAYVTGADVSSSATEWGSGKMKKLDLSPAAGHALCLSVLLAVLAAAVIVTKAVFPAFILPRLTITVLVGLSLGAQVLEFWLFRSEAAEYLETGLLAVAAFGVMTWAVGFAQVPGAGRVGIFGGVVYTVCLLVFTSMRAQLQSAGVKHKGAALTLAAALLLLASQSLAGIPVL